MLEALRDQIPANLVIEPDDFEYAPFGRESELGKVARLVDLERRIAGHNENIQTLFEAIRQLMAPPDKARRSIGFRVEEAALRYRTQRSTQHGK